MKLRTELPDFDYPINVSYQSTIFAIGSCFAIEMANILQKLKYKTHVNPCGICFNPVSILTCLRACLSSNSLPQNASFKYKDLNVHPDFHSSFNHPDASTHESMLKKAIKSGQDYLKETEFVLITLGTAFVYRSIKTNKIVNNCHKIPQSEFTKELLSTDSILETLNEITNLISTETKKSVKFIFSVSPVRHLKDGIIENQRSKSRLIEATHELISNRNDSWYFPSYELLMDDLRDYRFYEQDLLHPNQLAIDYIFQRFEKALLNQKEVIIRDRIRKINNMKSHKILFPESESAKAFKNKIDQVVDQFRIDYPFINI